MGMNHTSSPRPILYVTASIWSPPECCNFTRVSKVRAEGYAINSQAQSSAALIGHVCLHVMTQLPLKQFVWHIQNNKFSVNWLKSITT